MNNKYDIIAEIYLYPHEKGGRKQATPNNGFKCPFVMPNGDMHDARIDLSEHGSLKPGDKARLPIEFLRTEDVLPKIKKGSVLKLWELGIIGDATIIEINNSV